MRIALAQINCTVGDLAGNTKKILEYICRAKEQEVDLVLFPELAITGYPPEDLLLKPQFVTDNLAALRTIVKDCDDLAVYLGFVDRQGKDLYNAGAFIVKRKVQEIYHKMNLPNYAVFDEKRYFREGNKCSVISYEGMKMGLGICEDIWVERGPYEQEAKKGAKVILNINASPYHVSKINERAKMLKARAKSTKAHVFYVNMVGGQDELIFDGGSMAFDPQGKLIASAKQFQEDLLVFEIKGKPVISPWPGNAAEVYEALVLCVRDYVGKNGFKEVVVGLSGGVDSALTLAIAVDALGAQSVHSVFMPSPFTAQQSQEDSLAVAENLNVDYKTIPIADLYCEYLRLLSSQFEEKEADVTEENLQARIRGNILMALSNKFGWLVLTTGNKSEMSVGYTTLYGDMAGGFSVLKDVPKTLVYKLVEWRNQKRGEVIPDSIIKRPPTAELRSNQTDQDTLPPYEVLDPIIEAYVEDNKMDNEIVKLGFAPETVKKVITMIDHAEYKRRQAPPGPRITPRAFGKDWRVPITNKYRV